MKKLTCLLIITLTVMLTVMLPVYATAELSEERVHFYQARTEEWEAALGPYHLWNYNQRAMFCSIYHRLPGDYFNPEETVRSSLPTIPPEEALSYEEALHVAVDFLCSYDVCITEDDLYRLHIASAYYDFWDDAEYTITRTAHVQCWFIQFWDLIDSDNHIARCTVYLNAATGAVCSLELGLDMKHSEDWENYHTFRIQEIQKQAVS